MTFTITLMSQLSTGDVSALLHAIRLYRVIDDNFRERLELVPIWLIPISMVGVSCCDRYRKVHDGGLMNSYDRTNENVNTKRVTSCVWTMSGTVTIDLGDVMGSELVTTGESANDYEHSLPCMNLMTVPSGS